jgi:hypothetical protein
MDLPLSVLPSVEFHVFEPLRFQLFEGFRWDRDGRILFQGFKGFQVRPKLFESDCLECTAGIVLLSAPAKVFQEAVYFLK